MKGKTTYLVFRRCNIRSLAGYHYKTIILTVLLPAIVPAVIAYFAPDSFASRVIFYVAAFLVWSVSAVLAVASMLKRDRSEAEQLVSQKIKALSAQIGKLRDEHEDSRGDLRQQVNDLEDVVMSTLKEDLGIILPPRRVSLRARAVAGSPTASITLSVVGGSKMARLRQWFRRAMRRLWEWSTEGRKTARHEH